MEIFTCKEVGVRLGITQRDVAVLLHMMNVKKKRPFYHYRITRKQLDALEKFVDEVRDFFVSMD